MQNIISRKANVIDFQSINKIRTIMMSILINLLCHQRSRLLGKCVDIVSLWYQIPSFNNLIWEKKLLCVLQSLRFLFQNLRSFVLFNFLSRFFRNGIPSFFLISFLTSSSPSRWHYFTKQLPLFSFVRNISNLIFEKRTTNSQIISYISKRFACLQ